MKRWSNRITRIELIRRAMVVLARCSDSLAVHDRGGGQVDSADLGDPVSARAKIREGGAGPDDSIAETWAETREGAPIACKAGTATTEKPRGRA